MENTVVKRSFIKKWNRQSLPLRVFFLIILIGFLISLIFFTRSVLSLEGIETLIRSLVIIVLSVHLFILALGGIVLLFTNRKKRLIILLVLTAIYIPILSIASYYIDKTYNIIDNVQKKYVEYTSVMISMKDTLEYDKIGMISAKDDPTGYVIPQDIIKENKIDAEIVEYDDYISMMTELYDGEIDALFTVDSYITMFNSYEKFTNIETETKVVYKKSKELENVDNISYSTKNLTEPFTVLLMGVDATGDGISSNASFNGDTMMMITFNPKTLNATIFSIPRDTYVPIACNQNRENKINSSAYGGTSCVVKTIENLTGIKIDYYAKINFTGVVKLVDDLGGVTLDVPISFCEQDSQRRVGEYLICVDKGYQTLNGEQALAFARHRHSLPLGDFQRVQHQQMVVEAMVKELKNIESIDDFYTILDDVANNIDTNMSTSQILSLYSVGKNILVSALNNENISLSIQKTYLTGYDLTMYLDSVRSYVYTFQYYEQSLEEIIELMEVNLEIKKPTPIKTFDFDINKVYEVSVAGKNYYNEERRELLPNFIGKTKSEVEEWADERNISVEFTEEISNSPDGIVINQSDHSGKLVSSISTLKITLSIYEGKQEEPTEEEPDSKPNEDETEKEVITLPDFTGKIVDEFNAWKNSLSNANLITEVLELTADDMLTLGDVELKADTIYKQSHEKGTDVSTISTLKVFYYKEP